MPKRAPTTQKSNTYQTCSTPSQQPGTVWGHTRDIQKLFQGGTLGVRSTLGESNERGNYNAKKGPDHTKVKHLSNMLNPLTVTWDGLGAHQGHPETILGWYTWGAKYTWGVSQMSKHLSNMLKITMPKRGSPNDHTKVKHLSNMLNPLAATQDGLRAHQGHPETILGWYTWGAKYTWGVK